MTIETDGLNVIRKRIRECALGGESEALTRLIQQADLDQAARGRITANAIGLIEDVRADASPGLMEVFLAEYGLSTQEGVALMCLAEALLRVPDAGTIDDLIEDKIAPADWGKHIGQSSSPLVNASTWALLLTGGVLDEVPVGLAGSLRGALKRLGEPVIRTAVSRAMKELGRQFVLGRNIGEAMKRAAGMEKHSYTYSYDMLGEAARTHADAMRYGQAYSDAIASISTNARSKRVRDNPGISVKLSALHPRYEMVKREQLMEELVPRAVALAEQAKAAGMGFNIDAEEADRLDISLDIIEAIVRAPSLAGWDGFGVVVQAYGLRAPHVIDWLYALALTFDRRFMVRLVKGAYWDTEIKRAQVLGVNGFPVFTRKPSTDMSFMGCARKLLGMTERIYPQFATHNAHTVAAILEMAGDREAYEFQRLHGMGETLHNAVLAKYGTRCRIYAPVGAHEDLLAYLVRRLLENGANSSFVNQIVDTSVPPAEIATDPVAIVKEMLDQPQHPNIKQPADLYGASRRNAKGWDINDPVDLAELEALRAPYRSSTFEAGPILDGKASPEEAQPVVNPANPYDVVGAVRDASPADVEMALQAAHEGWQAWAKTDPSKRAAIIRRAADLYEDHAGAFFALAAREAGKTLLDAVGELREAVDFLRYYANETETMCLDARGVFVCISPWNFPLAIFSGQVSAALAAGNAVLAKPAEQTPLIAAYAVGLLHEAGIPRAALQLLPGAGAVVGGALTSDPRVSGVCFTGSTATAQRVNRSLATANPVAPLIAETGGLNAMIVDSTALPEQAVRDILASAFQSAGQRCSALRLLYVQEDVADRILEMLSGAMETLQLGDPWAPDIDVGPVIDLTAKAHIEKHISIAWREGRLLWQADSPKTGLFVPPTILKVTGIGDMKEEIFGPVLHVARFEASQIADVVNAINASGYGLTFGLHTRIDDRVQEIVETVTAGNTYVNRNQIGAIVGSQPFGGEGLSGTGPKAGGPHYLKRFALAPSSAPIVDADRSGKPIELADVSRILARLSPPIAVRPASDLPGPTGESNRLSVHPRGVVLCLGPDKNSLSRQVKSALDAGCAVLAVAAHANQIQSNHPGEGRLHAIAGALSAQTLGALDGFHAVAIDGDVETIAPYRQALAGREGAILPLIRREDGLEPYSIERHLCVDTTAAGGNAALLAASQ